MKNESDYHLRKRLKQLEEENKGLRDKLYNFRTTTYEIYDAVAENAGSGDGISKKWLLKTMRRCLQ